MSLTMMLGRDTTVMMCFIPFLSVNALEDPNQENCNDFPQNGSGEVRYLPDFFFFF